MITLTYVLALSAIIFSIAVAGVFLTDDQRRAAIDRHHSIKDLWRRVEHRMQRRYSSRLAAATLGEDGVLAFDGDRLLHTPAYWVPVVDTTGAGDIFHAGFIYALLQNWPLDRQLEFACAAAALNCTAVGARGGIHSLDDIANLVVTGAKHPITTHATAPASK